MEETVVKGEEPIGGDEEKPSPSPDLKLGRSGA